MDVKQLRVGNYIERHNKVTGVKDIIQVDGGTPLLSFEGMTTLQFDPIPLTEEWLLKCGFEELYDDKVFLKDSFEYRDKKVYFGTSSISIQYVHQLQNLFFSLCGEELQLK